MTVYQVYEHSIKPLSVAEKLTLARLIIDEIVPETGPLSEAAAPAEARKPREFGAGRHLLAGVDIEALLATPIDDMFADYMPEDR